jgi:hypothetical protein
MKFLLPMERRFLKYQPNNKKGRKKRFMVSH